MTTIDPRVWGPKYWFSLHVSAMHYPEAASPTTQEHLANRIRAIPFELPCQACREHSLNYLKQNDELIVEAVKGRMALFEFYVDLHNFVNKRLNKTVMSYADAWEKYGSA